MKEVTYMVTMNTGFARPATLFVQIARSFMASISIHYQGTDLHVYPSFDSIFHILDLNVRAGSVLSIRAHGVEEAIAILAFREQLKALGVIGLRES
jgi:phosphotransferase system HPr (HPr) family protein